MLFNFFMTALAESGEVTSDTTSSSSTGEVLSMIIMLVVMFAILYFMMIRPQKKKEKKVKNMLDALKPGDRICTIGGLYGTIISIKDDDITITLGSQQNTIVIARWAVRSVEDAPLENDIEPEI